MYRIGKISQRARKAAFGVILGLVGAFILLFSGGCGICKYCPKEKETIIEVRDSVRVETRIDTFEVQLPPIYVKDYTDLGDTLHLSTGTAEASAWVNQDKGLLEGEIHNTDKPLPVLVPSTQEEHFHSQDSTSTQIVEVEKEVIKYQTPNWAWWLLIGNVILLAGFIIYMVLKFKLH